MTTVTQFQDACQQAADILNSALGAGVVVKTPKQLPPINLPDGDLNLVAKTKAGAKVTSVNLNAFLNVATNVQPEWISWTVPNGLPAPSWTAIVVGTTPNSQFPEGIGRTPVPYTITDKPISAAEDAENVKVLAQVDNITLQFLAKLFPAYYKAPGPFTA